MNDKEKCERSSAGSSSSYGAINHDVTRDPHQHHTSTASDHNDFHKGRPEQEEQQRAKNRPLDGHSPLQEEPQTDKHTLQNSSHESPAKTSRSGPCGVMPIEVPVFLFNVAYSIIGPVTQYYLTDRISEDLGVANGAEGSGTGGSQGEDGSVLSDQAQAEVATYTMIISFLTNLPAILPALFMGALSDRFGRKAILYIVLSGMVIRVVVCVLVFRYHGRIEYLYLGSVVEGLTGGISSYVMASFSVVADITEAGTPQRGFRITVVEAMTMIGQSVGNMVVGYWVMARGYVPPLLFCIGLQVTTLLFTLLFIPETFAGSHRTTPVTCSVLFGSVQVFLQRGRRGFLLICMVAYLLGHFNQVGTMSIAFLYLLSPPFNWTESHLSTYAGVAMVTSWLTVLAVTSCLVRKVADVTSALIGVLSGILGYLFMALARSDLFVYLACAANLLSNLTWPMLRVMMSKAVDSDEQGSLFAVIAVMQILSATVAGVVSPAIYKASLGHVHGLIFFCYAAIDVVVGLCLISVRNRTPQASEKALQGEDFLVAYSSTEEQ